MSEYQIRLSTPFLKKEARFLKKHPELIPQYEKTLHLLGTNPYHPSLRLHKLKDLLQAFHSVSINMKYRITLEFMIQDHLIIPIHIGSHDEIYR